MRNLKIAHNNLTTSNQLVEAIKINDARVLKELYQTNYKKIEILILKNSGTIDHAKDIYQEAFLTVWQNVKQDKFQPQSETALIGYLYTIAKNKWMDFLRSKEYKKTVVSSTLNNFNISDSGSENNDDDILKENRLQDVMQVFKHLGSSCKSLLMKFYFEKKSMDTIAEELQLDTASTRNKKYRCMQKLRALVLKNE